MVLVLLFLQIITILGLYLLSSSIQLCRLNSSNWEKASAMLSLDELLPVLIANIQNEIPPCSIAKVDVSSHLTQPELFHTCKGQLQQLQYDYVVEPLGEAPCAVLENIDMSRYSANYFRITLLAVTKRSHFKIIIQSTVIKPLGRLEKCDGARYPVSTGQQSWKVI